MRFLQLSHSYKFICYSVLSLLNHLYLCDSFICFQTTKQTIALSSLIQLQHNLDTIDIEIGVVLAFQSITTNKIKFTSNTFDKIVGSVLDENASTSTTEDGSKLNEILDCSAKVPITMNPIFRVLKGHSLCKHNTKFQAIVDFLSMFSYNSFLHSNDSHLTAKNECNL